MASQKLALPPPKRPCHRKTRWTLFADSTIRVDPRRAPRPSLCKRSAAPSPPFGYRKLNTDGFPPRTGPSPKVRSRALANDVARRLPRFIAPLKSPGAGWGRRAIVAKTRHPLYERAAISTPPTFSMTGHRTPITRSNCPRRRIALRALAIRVTAEEAIPATRPVGAWFDPGFAIGALAAGEARGRRTQRAVKL